MKIIWNGHACYTIESEEGTIVLDPYKDGSVPGYGPLRLKADAVYCSHGHGDHAATEVVTLSGKLCEIPVSVIDTWHDDKKGKLRGPNRIHTFLIEGMRVVHLGDLGCALTKEQAGELAGADVLMIPIGGFYTIDGVQAAEIVRALMPRIVLPMHYRTEKFGYDVIGTPEAFCKAVGEDAISYVNGNSLTVTKDTPAQIAFFTVA